MAAISCVCFFQEAASSQATMVRVTHDTFVANQASFTHGQIKYILLTGKSKSLEDARNGVMHPMYRAEGLYLFDRKLARFELIYPAAVLKAATVKVGRDEISSIESVRMATNGDTTLCETTLGTSQGLKLVPGRVEFDREFQFPIALGQPTNTRVENLGRYLSNALNGVSDFQVATIDSNATHDNRPVTKIAFSLRFGTAEFWVDMERGAVPLEIVGTVTASAEKPGHESVYLFDDVRFAKDRGWLPYKETWWHSHDHTCGQIVILDANFEKPPERSAFAIEFPKAITLYDKAKGLRYPAQRSWNVSSLPAARDRGVEKVQVATLGQGDLPVFPDERESGPRYRLLILGSVALVLTVILILWIRRGQNG